MGLVFHWPEQALSYQNIQPRSQIHQTCLTWGIVYVFPLKLYRYVENVSDFEKINNKSVQ